MDLFMNEFFRLYLDGINVWIEVYKEGYDIKNFQLVSDQVPRLKLTNFMNLTKALNLTDKRPTIIGVYRHTIEVTLSSDALEAWMQIFLTATDYIQAAEAILPEMINALKNAGVTTGIFKHVFEKPPELMSKFQVAQGIAPVKGEDAKISYYKLSEPKPEVMTDGKVNHYNLNLIDNVSKGEWLGEKTPPSLGTPGVNVLGEEIPTQPGKDLKLRYDPKTVTLKTENGIDVLRAMMDGAVKVTSGRIRVDNHLVINGDVDFNTGNIDFDGFVTVQGTVQDGFSVIASEDITINGPLGIGAVTEIRSKKGSILISGGINGKNVAKITAGHDVFLKYANECTIRAGRTINIGFYAMDSILQSKKVIVNPKHGRVIGGRVEAEHQIIAGIIGNKSERTTEIFVKGFERGNVKEELDAVLIQYSDLLSRGNKIKRQLEVFENHIGDLDEKALNTYEGIIISYELVLEDIYRLNRTVEQLQDILKTRGEGEVQITQTAYPKTFLAIKNLQKRVKDSLCGSFYVKDNDLHFES
jgi:uncharacterized protein (DUF342 family)